MSKKKKKTFNAPDIPRSKINDKNLIFVGFSFGVHPQEFNKFVQISLYKIENEDEHIICISEGFGKGDVDLSLPGLGKPVPGHLIAPFAQRGIVGKMELEELKQVMMGTNTDKWYWME